MAVFTVPLADRNHSGVTQLRFAAPEMLLEDGRILPFLSRLTTLCTGGRCAWELLLTSQATPSGTELDARLITHISVPAAQRAALTDVALAAREKLLEALQQSDIPADAPDTPLPNLRETSFIVLGKPCQGLINADAALSPGQLRQRLCTQPGNGVSLVLVQSDWEDGELALHARDESPERQTMLARDPVFRFAVTLWGPDAAANAVWLQGLTLGGLAPVAPRSPGVYPVCLRKDPWHMLTLLPQEHPHTALLTLSELLTLCGCPAEPGEMQQMCRVGWREQAARSLQDADLSLLAMDMTLREEDLRCMGLNADSDLENVLHMSADMCDMLRMCVAILRRLGVLQANAPAAGSDDRAAHLTGLLLPTVGHIYEQFVRECCYKTMYRPYYACISGRPPLPVAKVFLSTYDIGPDSSHYRDGILGGDTSNYNRRNIMYIDFANHATINGEKADDRFWSDLFDDMGSARARRNDLTHEKASLVAARDFARAFLLKGRNRPSLLLRLLMCRSIATNFPPYPRK